MGDDNEQLARFEEMGEDAVRILAYTQRFTTKNQRLAIKWLAQKYPEYQYTKHKIRKVLYTE